MACFQRWFLVFAVLVLGGGTVFAASSREERAYAAAVAAFHDGIYDQAAAQLGHFVQEYPHSAHLPEAVLYQAQAQYQLRHYGQAIATLSAPPADWGRLADQYTYWLGEAEYARGNFARATSTFTNLTIHFTKSSLRLTSAVEAAAAMTQLKDWPRIESWLGNPDGVFARAASKHKSDELIVRGRLLLAEAQLKQHQYSAASKTLDLLKPLHLPPAESWKLASLQCQVALGQGKLDAALGLTTNLLALAPKLSPDTAARLADSIALRASTLERMGHWAEAETNWEQNLATNAPITRQREAILKMAADATAQKKYTDAEAALATYLTQFPHSPLTGLAQLTAGELNLKQYVAKPADTNHLAAALGRLDQLLTDTNHDLSQPELGRAHLDRGWCYWLNDNFARCFADFQTAAKLLPFSENQAMARFKSGDALFALKNYVGARTNYLAVLDDYTNLPAVQKSMGDRALYQVIGASIKLRDAAGAERAMRRLLKVFPQSSLADDAMLLLGDGLSSFDSPTNALRVLREFAKRFPHSPLRPQVDLETARTYERTQDWPAAIAGYRNWLSEFSTNNLRSQVEYSLAWAQFQAGEETNALARFKRFVSQFPSSKLAPLAQWWVADYYFRLGGTNYPEAEKNYEFIFQNTNAVWQKSGLFYPAQLMAGRAAAGRLGFSDASRYFQTMIADTNCPPRLVTQALFAYGGILMKMDSPDANQPLANYQLATNVFVRLVQANATNRLGALAESELGDCDLQLGALKAATNAYWQVMHSPHAGVGLRCRAQVGLGRVLQKMAESASAKSKDRQVLRQEAIKNYLAVFQTSLGRGLTDDETPAAFWVKKAGLELLPLLSANGNYPSNFLDRMERLLPPLKPTLEKKRAALEAKTQ